MHQAPNTDILAPKNRYETQSLYAWFLVFYTISQIVGISLGYGVESISVLWPPTGILGAALALLPRKHWIPVLLLGAVVDFTSGVLSNNFRVDPNFLSYLIVGQITNPITAVCFALSFRVLIPSRRPLSEPKLFGLYVLVPIVLNTAIVSFLAMSMLSTLIEGFPFARAWQQWWYSDMAGLLLFATPIIMVASARGRIIRNKRRVPEALTLLALFTIVAFALFSTPFDQALLGHYKLMIMIPLYVWIIARFGAVVISVSALLFTLAVLSALVRGNSPFIVLGRDPGDDVLAVQGFLVPATFTTLFIAALLEHRKHQFDELLENERRIRSLSRVESLGTMAAGVAHDFGNLTIAIRAYLSVLKSQIENPNEKVYRAIQGLEEATDGAQSLTKALMVFARDDSTMTDTTVTTPETIDLSQAVEEAAEAMRNLVSPKHEIHCEIAQGPIPVSIGEQNIQRIVTNLIINARDASEPGTRIEVAVRSIDDRAWVLVTDHGSGIPPEVQERMFDPFYTTKPRGRGTGLGLSVVSGIVRDARGNIHVASTPGEGTTIVINLPIAETKPQTGPLNHTSIASDST